MISFVEFKVGYGIIILYFFYNYISANNLIFNLFMRYFLFLFFLFGCSKSGPVEPDFSYYNLNKTSWKSKNHIYRTDNLIFTVTEVPVMYYISHTYGEENFRQIDSAYQTVRDQRIIEFVIENKGHKDLFDSIYTNIDNYSDVVEYFSSTIKKDFYLLTSKKDTVLCNGVLFERTFKLSPHKKLLLYFENIDSEEEIELIYKDQLFNKGEIKYKLNNHLIKL